MSAPSAYPVEFAYAVGSSVYFRYLTEADAVGNWHHWFNSPDVTQNLAAQYWVNTPEGQLEYMQNLRRSKERLALAVVDRKTHEHIGIGSLSKLDMLNRRAEMSLVIGSAAHRSGFHALESLAMLTEIGLVRLNLHKLVATGLSRSEGGLNLTRLLGYVQTGCFREHAFVGGTWVDCVYLEILQREWLKSPRRPKTIGWSLNEHNAG
jgi:RimJ/RimL family protein N-acetyltransferase